MKNLKTFESGALSRAGTTGDQDLISDFPTIRLYGQTQACSCFVNIKYYQLSLLVNVWSRPGWGNFFKIKVSYLNLGFTRDLDSLFIVFGLESRLLRVWDLLIWVHHGHWDEPWHWHELLLKHWVLAGVSDSTWWEHSWYSSAHWRHHWESCGHTCHCSVWVLGCEWVLKTSSSVVDCGTLRRLGVRISCGSLA